MAQGQLSVQSLQNDRNIAHFIVEGTATGRQLGIGSYGSVEEVEVNGLICAGKKIHEALLDAGNVGIQEITSKYMQECQLMSDLRHPNITLFLGVCFLPNCHLPVLLMEKLDGSLDDLLETVPNIPLVLKRSLLEDIAKGLLYLHKHDPQIVHRDLTAKNVLLTSSLVAKITDFGNSRIVNFQPGQLACTFSRLPGTLVYMPPEALTSASHYGPSLDVFSFGHLALFTLTQVFPGNLLEPNFVDLNTDQLIPHSEVERRREYFKQLEVGSMLGGKHPCVQMTKQCLNNSPSRRPTAEQLVATLEGMRADIEGPCGPVARADAVRQVVMMKTLRESEIQVREKTNELKTKDTHIQELQQHLDLLQVDLQHKETELHEKDIMVDRIQKQLERIQDKAFGNNMAVKQKDTTIRQLQKQLDDAREEIAHHQCCTKRTQPQLSEIEFPLNISWECGQDMPIMMDYYPDIVILKGRMFIGGGVFGADARAYLVTRLGQYTVMMYNIEKEIWGTLPPYNFYWFSLTSLNDQLVLVGGVWRHTPKRTNLLGVLDDRGGTSNWTHTLPPMPTPRSGATVITHNNRWILVAGGFHEQNGCLSVVEIFDNLTRQWYGSTPLPLKGFKLSSTVIKNTWYLLGGYTTDDAGYRNKQVVYTDLNDFIAQAVLQSAVASPAQWLNLPDTPLKRSTALTLNGALLAIGGDSDDLAICLYQPACKTWTRSEELLCARKDCACAALPGGRLILVGGDTKQVQIGTFKTKYM